jgi:hypothetical protein
MTIMKKIVLTCALVFLTTTLHASTKSTLTRISEEKTKNTIEIHLFFDIPPKYIIQQSGKRINLILERAIVADSSLDFTTDDMIVKFLPLVTEEQAVLSFFLRYTPKKVNVTIGKDNTLLLTINVDSVILRTQTDIVSNLKERKKVPDPTKNHSNPLLASPYAYDWRQFFLRYETEVSIKAPVQYTLPSFPVIGLLPPDKEKNLLLIPAEVNSLASTGQWNAMVPLLAELLKNEKDLEKGKKIALTYGEVLFRAGNFAGAYKQFYLLEHSYHLEPIAVFAKFLLAGLEAAYEDPFIGDYKLQELESSVATDSPLTPYFILLRIETALATNQLKKMQSLLTRDNVSYPEKILRLIELRKADFWHASKSTIKAYVRYQLLNDPTLIEEHYYSLNGYCGTLYQQKLFPEAAQCYQKLAHHITDKAQLGMVGYRKAMSEFHSRQQTDMITDFSTISDAFAGTDAGYKAALKKADILFLSQKTREAASARAYRIIAEKATVRDTAEEAALKEALVYRITDKKEKCIELLMTFLRNFRTGNLIETAQAVLLDILPGELQRLVQEKEYVKALVLAKQNQTFFEKKWLDIGLLADIAVSYEQLGLFDEARNTYLYLIEVGGEKAEKDNLFPLINVHFHQGKFDEVDMYAAQYAHKFPAGKDIQRVLLLRLRALLASGKIDQAISLLPSPLLDDLELQDLAATIYFQKNDYKKITDILSPLWDKQVPLNENSRLLLAESLYKQDMYDKAEIVFSTLTNAARFQDQSLFRLADMQIKKGQLEKAVKLYQQVVDKGKDPLWQDLAKKELQYITLSKKP